VLHLLWSSRRLYVLIERQDGEPRAPIGGAELVFYLWFGTGEKNVLENAGFKLSNRAIE
jgi:hypothetical protein